MRGKQWTKEADDILLAKYANTTNAELIKEMGYGLRTIERHASQLGLRKSKEFMDESQRKGVNNALLWYEYKRITGQKIIRCRQGGRPFKKGEKLPPELEKKRIEAIRRRAWEDRKRIIHGFQPKAKWRYNLSAYDSFKQKDNDDK